MTKSITSTADAGVNNIQISLQMCKLPGASYIKTQHRHAKHHCLNTIVKMKSVATFLCVALVAFGQSNQGQDTKFLDTIKYEATKPETLQQQESSTRMERLEMLVQLLLQKGRARSLYWGKRQRWDLIGTLPTSM